ncbi:MAG: cupin-like domain-containing protein [Myxococcales bacterium]|nr:cupin-like domain-containing protein [Myxococcales bacterium]
MVAPSWRRWVADNLLRGVEPTDLAEGLREGGVPSSLAHRTVAEILASPGLAAARAARVEALRLAHVVRLQGAMAGPPAVARELAPDADGLRARYWATSTPVVFTDIVPRWRRPWTPEDLCARFGDVTIEACTGREGDPSPDANWQAHRVELTLREYVDRMRGHDRSNDLYLIANNRNTARPELRALWDDVVLPEGWFQPARLPYGSALWLGPAGTITPLHHDTSNILFCQVYGRKRIVLAPPWATALLDSAVGVYNRRTPQQLRDEGIPSVEVIVQPGEALFLPVGWWHDVRALDASVSLAINAFGWPNGLDWYRPGRER